MSSEAARSSSVLEAFSDLRARGALQFYTETTTLAWLRIEANLAAHALDGFLDDGQADAGWWLFALAVHALEHFEHSSLRLFWDADAVVFNPNADRRIFDFRFSIFDFGTGNGRL